MIPKKIEQKIKNFAANITLFKLNGEMDGYDGKTRKDGWNELCETLTAEGLNRPEYSMKVIYENGWTEGWRRRQKELNKSQNEKDESC